MVAKTAKAAGLDNITIGGIKIDPTRIGKIDGSTLVDALSALHVTAKAPIALIIDEAQHVLTSMEGENTMAALKSARDQLNAPDSVNLMLVMSGSDRDKLLCPNLIPVDSAQLFKAFKIFGSRPQFFMEALGGALSPLADISVRFEVALVAAAEQRQHDDEHQMESEYLSLKPSERAVLWRLLEQGQRFRPYDAETLRFHREISGVTVQAQKAQNALESLRQRSPALVWKSARGEYAVDDAAMHRWFAERLQSGKWPPAEPENEIMFSWKKAACKEAAYQSPHNYLIKSARFFFIIFETCFVIG